MNMNFALRIKIFGEHFQVVQATTTANETSVSVKDFTSPSLFLQTYTLTPINKYTHTFCDSLDGWNYDRRVFRHVNC